MIRFLLPIFLLFSTPVFAGYAVTTTGEEWDDFKRIDSMMELNGNTKEDVFLEKYED